MSTEENTGGNANSGLLSGGTASVSPGDVGQPGIGMSNVNEGASGSATLPIGGDEEATLDVSVVASPVKTSVVHTHTATVTTLPVKKVDAVGVSASATKAKVDVEDERSRGFDNGLSRSKAHPESVVTIEDDIVAPMVATETVDDSKRFGDRRVGKAGVAFVQEQTDLRGERSRYDVQRSQSRVGRQFCVPGPHVSTLPLPDPVVVDDEVSIRYPSTPVPRRERFDDYRPGQRWCDIMGDVDLDNESDSDEELGITLDQRIECYERECEQVAVFMLKADGYIEKALLNGTAERVQRYRDEKAKRNTRLLEINEMLEAIKPIRSRNRGADEAPPSVMTHTTTSEVVKAKKLPPNIPQFDNEAKWNVHGFLSNFEYFLLGHGVPESDWTRALLVSCSADPMAAQLVRVEAIDRCLTWVQFRVLFLRRYFGLNAQSKLREQFESLRMSANESILDYCDKFSSALRAAGEREHSDRVCDRFMSSLDPAIRGHAYGHCGVLITSGNLALLMEKVVELTVFLPVQVALSAAKLQQSTSSQRSASTPEKQRSAAPTRRPRDIATVKCFYCAEMAHYAKDCPRKLAGLPKARAAIEAAKTAASGDSARVTGACYKCGQHGHFARQCTTPRGTSGGDPAELNVAVAVTSGSAENELPFVPVHLNGTRVMALADTGANVCVVSEALANTLACEVVPVEQRVFVMGAFVSAVGAAELEVAVHDKAPVKQRFLVLDSPHLNDRVVLSVGLLARIGVALCGIPLMFPDEEKPLASADDDHEWVKEPDGVEIVHQDIEVGMVLVDAQLSANEALPVGGFCTHPDALIRLRLKPGEKPQWRAPYRLSVEDAEFADGEVARWVLEEIVEEVSGVQLCNTPVFVVHGRKRRLCLDGRVQNAVLEDPVNTLPRINDVVSSIEHCDLISSLDLRGGFGQVRFDEQSKPLTSFTWRGRTYRSLRASLGFKCVPAQFHSLMEAVLAEVPRGVGEHVCVYLDDLVLATDGLSLEQHAALVNRVIAVLTKYSLVLNKEKSALFRTTAQVLGHCVGNGGRAAVLSMIDALDVTVKPVTLSEVRSIVGSFTYLKQYAPHFAAVIATLHRFRSDADVRDGWDAADSAVLVQLKDILLRAPRLYALPRGHEVVVHVSTDASLNGVGVVVYFEEVIRSATFHRVLHFASKPFNSAQRRYSSYRRELLGVVFALQRFRSLLLGRRVQLHVDSRALLALKYFAATNRTVQSWFDVLSEFDFDVVHRPGASVDHAVADFLSRWLRPPVGPDAPMMIGERLEVNMAGLEVVGAVTPGGAPEVVGSLAPVEEVVSLLETGDEVMPDLVDAEDVDGSGVANFADVHEPRGVLAFDDGVDVVANDLRVLARSLCDSVEPPVVNREAIVEREHLKAHQGVRAVVRAVVRGGYHWSSLLNDVKRCCSKCTTIA